MDNDHVSCFLCSLVIFDKCRLQPSYPWSTYNFLKATMKKQISQNNENSTQNTSAYKLY